MDGAFIIPAPRGSEGYVELARSAKAGTTYRGAHFRKHILNLGTLIHPKTKQPLNLDENWFSQLSKNFDNGACDIVSVPLANAKNEHTEYPLDNTGEVMGVSREGRKVYVDLDVRRPEVAQGLRDGTLLGASAFLHMNYEDTATGQKVGPTLLHSCITNRPHVTGLDPYEEVIAATASDTTGEVVILTELEEPPKMDLTKAELIAGLKEHGIDVEALQATAASAGDTSALVAALTQAMQGNAQAGELYLTGANGDTVGLREVVGAVAELAGKVGGLESANEALTLSRAEDEIDNYIAQGRVLPHQRASYLHLRLTNPELMANMLPQKPVVPLNQVAGTSGEPAIQFTQTGDIDEEVARLTASHGRFFGNGKK